AALPYTAPLSLHDALPISCAGRAAARPGEASLLRSRSVPSGPRRSGGGRRTAGATGRRNGMIALDTSLLAYAVNRHAPGHARARSEEHTSELQSRSDIVCR